VERQRFLSLLEKYTTGEATENEVALLDEYYKRLDAMSDVELSEKEENIFKASILKKIQSQIESEKQELKLVPKRSYKTIWYAAASVLFLIAAGSYFIRSDKNRISENKSAVSQKQSIPPGSDKAVLTLSNGEQIVLSSENTGALTSQGAAQLTKKANGELVYSVQDQSAKANAPVNYNTITVPRGGQYRLVLADGSKVLLNAASSLTYPTTFNGKYRNVELKGEGYFEIAKNEAMPFIVKADDVEVRVLGTHFNISAYPDDSNIITTLIEGAVSMQKGGRERLLKPGQQGTAQKNLSSISVQNADIEQAMGWVSGNFVFKDLNIKDVMKIVSRWYDVDAEYQGNAQFKKFGGTTSRYSNITELLDYMKITGGVNYKIEGRRIVFMN
jgi:hypothetical protein